MPNWSKVECPFYKAERYCSISCESLITQESSIEPRTIVYLGNKETKENFKKRYCKTNYPLCPYYLAILKKYN